MPNHEAYLSTQTSEALLCAARTEFAAHGLGGGRVNRIAQAAGVNKERIYGYFGSKEHLFEIVVAAALDELVAAIPLNRDDDVVEHVLATFDYHRQRPELLRLLMWEALHYPETRPPSSASRVELYRKKVTALAAIAGHEPDDRTALVLFLLTGLAAWPNAMPQLGATITGTPVTGEGSRAILRDLITAMIGGLSAEADTSPSS